MNFDIVIIGLILSIVALCVSVIPGRWYFRLSHYFTKSRVTLVRMHSEGGASIVYGELDRVREMTDKELIKITVGSNSATDIRRELELFVLMRRPEVTLEDMIAEGSLTALQAARMGYRWDAAITGGDALEIRQDWLGLQQVK